MVDHLKLNNWRTKIEKKITKLVVGKKFDNSNPFFIAEIGNNHLGK